MTQDQHLRVEAGKNADRYLAGRRSELDRYSSWDHCFNYFRKLHDQEGLQGISSGQSLHQSCLHLGFYLASWGMYRGRAALLQRSSMALESVIHEVVTAPEIIWSLDVDSYTSDSIESLLDFAERIRTALPKSRNERIPTDTLVTKTMLGVFGNVPAFDRFFRGGFGAYSLGRQSLKKIRGYFDKYSEEIQVRQVATIDFAGHETSYRYTAAKVIDMIFFVEGGGLG